jgi:hypothetical protein
MPYLRVRTLLAAALAAALPGVAAAQFPPPPPPPGAPAPTLQDRWPEPTKPSPQQPGPKPAQTTAPKRPSPRSAAAPAAPAAHKPHPQSAANVIICGGVFGKNSSHLKLAQKYDSRNIVYGQVDASDGSKINASILFPNDPKRRLEVVWNNEAARSDLSVIAINRKSKWMAPKGLRLGLSIVALEKLNRRPFKLTGFGKDGSASALDWQGGALTSLPGGCKVGVRLFVNAKTPEAARSAVAGKEFLSSNAGVRAVKPTIGEILIGY